LRITIIDSAKVYLLFITFCIYLCWYVNFCFTRFTYILLKLFANLFYFFILNYVLLWLMFAYSLFEFWICIASLAKVRILSNYYILALTFYLRGIINRENTNLSFYSALSILFIYFLKLRKYLSLELRRGRLTFIFVILFTKLLPCIQFKDVPIFINIRLIGRFLYLLSRLTT
jgi:hypothetical protein